MSTGRVLGLDIGSRNLKMALVRRGGQGTVLCGFLIREFPSEMRENLPARENFAIETVRDFLRQNSIRGASAYCCLPTGAMGESTLQLPPMTGKELRQAVRMHVKKKFGNGGNSYLFDFNPMLEGFAKRDGNTVVQLAVAPEETPRTLMRTAEASGLQVKGISVWGIAIENLVHAGKFTSEKCVAVLDIGAVRSAVGVFRDGHLHFAREILTGGDAFTKALTEMPIRAAAREFLDIATAERMKRRYGIIVDGDGAELENEEAARLSAMLRPQVERLLVEVKRSVDYYRQSFDSQGVRELYLCGGGARLKNLAVFLSRELGISVKILPVAECVRFSSESVAEQFMNDAIAMAAAVGTALDDGKKINLLPGEVFTDRKIGKAKNLFQILLIAGLVLMFYGRQQASKELVRLKASIAVGKEALSLMQDGLAKVEILNRLRKELDSIGKVLTPGNERGPDWVGVLKEISNIIPANILLSELASESNPGEKGIALRGKVLEGAMMKNLELSEFLLQLEGSPFFRDVSLRRNERGGSEEAAEFEIECDLR